MKINKKNIIKIFPNIILFIKIYSLAIVFFFIFRFVLFLSGTNYIESFNLLKISYAFFIGIRFDIVISGYILTLPFIFFTIFLFFEKKENSHKIHKINKIIFYFIFLVFTFCFLICAADIPYFHQFFQRFSVTALEWTNSSPVFIFNMITQEIRYWSYLILFIILVASFYFLLKKIFTQDKLLANFTNTNHKILNILVSIIFLLLMVLGIRGRIDEKSPIRVGTAYFCDNSFLNQLGLNPNFTFLVSCFEKNNSINLINEQLALSNIKKSLNISSAPDIAATNNYTNSNNNTKFNNPIARNIYFGSALDSNYNSNSNYNIVLIIMESMSAEKMSRHGCNKNLTPFLDSLANVSYYFENCYTTGMHTFNGIAGTLFSIPAIFRQHILKSTPIKKHSGLATVLQKHNYETIYFTTHDGQFDNIEGFLRHNGFNQIISASDYPAGESRTTLGVPDDYMFRFSIPILNKISKTNKPFLSVFLTSSDHGPYYIPEYFVPHSKNIKNQIVEYADYSLNKFITLAQKQRWFSNTIFIFVADHGASLNSIYDVPLSYFHTPLIFYAPNIIKTPNIFNKLASQIDIYPTIMNLLKISYSNETLGIDLFENNREFVVLNADDKYGVISKNWLLISNNNNLSLYKYLSKDKINYAIKHPDTVKIMKTYAESYMQAFQYINKIKY